MPRNIGIETLHHQGLPREHNEVATPQREIRRLTSADAGRVKYRPDPQERVRRDSVRSFVVDVVLANYLGRDAEIKQ